MNHRAGIDFFKYAYDLIKEKAGDRTQASMQTNGTLITPKIADFLIENKI